MDVILTSEGKLFCAALFSPMCGVRLSSSYSRCHDKRFYFMSGVFVQSAGVIKWFWQFLPRSLEGFEKEYLVLVRVQAAVFFQLLFGNDSLLFSGRYGRVNYVLSRRLELLQEVARLQESLGVPGDVSYTCETAGHFYLYQVRYQCLSQPEPIWVSVSYWPESQYIAHKMTNHHQPSTLMPELLLHTCSSNEVALISSVCCR